MKLKALWSFLLLLCFMQIASLPVFAAEIYVVNSESRTMSYINTETNVVNNSFSQLGLTPNRFTMDEEFLYIAVSGDNAIQMISRNTGAHIRYIPVAPSSNPWDCLKVGDFLYVTGLFTGKLYKISLNTYSVVNQISVGTSPEGLALAGNKLYVTNAGLYTNNYVNSSVSVIDLDSFSVTNTIPVCLNPQYVSNIGGQIHVSCTGNWTNQFGKVYVIDPVNDEVSHILDVGGNLGNLWYDNSSKVYAGDGMNSGLYSYDALSYELYHNSTNPISPGGMLVSGTSEFIAILDSAWGGNGKVKLINHDLSFLHEYTVAMAPTDMQIYRPSTDVSDNLLPAPPTKVYPNPVNGGGTLYFESKAPSRAKITIYNIKGQLVDSFDTDAKTSSWNSFDNKGTPLSPGIYMYRRESAKGSSTGKFLIR